MRWIIAAVAALAAMPANGQGMTVQSGVFRERAAKNGMRIEPAASFARGDTVVTVMTWQGARAASHTIVSAVPAGLDLESVSHSGLQVSTDGGRTWRSLSNARNLPAAVTHLRWRAAGSGQVSYRAVVR